MQRSKVFQFLEKSNYTCILKVYNAEINISELYLEKRCMQVKFYSTTQFSYNVVNGEEGFFLKVGRLESKVLTLDT